MGAQCGWDSQGEGRRWGGWRVRQEHSGSRRLSLLPPFRDRQSRCGEAPLGGVWPLLLTHDAHPRPGAGKGTLTRGHCSASLGLGRGCLAAVDTFPAMAPVSAAACSEESPGQSPARQTISPVSRAQEATAPRCISVFIHPLIHSLGGTSTPGPGQGNGE